MSKAPRRLKVLRIDDTTGAPLNKTREAYDLEPGDGCVRPPLDLVVLRSKDNICLRIAGLGWVEQFWAAFTERDLPDIVLSDIDFEHDATSPLQFLPRATAVQEQLEANAGSKGQPLWHIPTGLSHTKALASIARCMGRPIIVAMYTGNSAKWQGMKSEDRVFGLLAAQEVIELAAILGTPVSWSVAPSFERVWNWLAERTHADPTKALRQALNSYRQQLIAGLRGQISAYNLRVPYGAGADLKNWCGSMSKDPRPLQDDAADIGLPLLYPDGTIDRISFASLFADVETILSAPLPPHCFDLTPATTDPIWELVNGLPRIGAWIAELLQVDDAVHAAIKALEALPIEQDPLERNLTDEIKDSLLARGLAVLFRTIELYCADEQKWKSIWSHDSWDPIALRPVETDDDRDQWPGTKSLSEWLLQVEAALRESSDSTTGYACIGDIHPVLCQIIEQSVPQAAQRVRATKENWVRVHLDLLRARGRVTARTGGDGEAEYKLVGRARKLADAPRRPATGVINVKWNSDALTSLVKDTLGFGKRGPRRVNDHQPGRILYEAFLANSASALPDNEAGKAGREFRNAFLRGDGPPWVLQICREFCRVHLNWKDENNWPQCLRANA